MQNTPTKEAAFDEAIDPIFPLEQYLERLIWVAYTQNTDATAQNFFLYNSNPGVKPLWHMIPWDSDIALGNHWSFKESAVSSHRYLLIDGGNYFSRRLMKIGCLRERYVDLFEDMIATIFTEEAIDALLEHYFGLVEEELGKDLERWQQKSSAKEEFDEIADFFSERPSALLEALDGFRETGEYED
ncbi:MAG: CotH kinase family protein [Deltaproteobacteria bacterium]|nr:CotH kinase family protein [Deltaproteobacteria bacterium]